MPSFPHTLRPAVPFAAEEAPEKDTAGPGDGPIRISLTTLSTSGNFDSYIEIRFAGAAGSVRLLVDSGNTMLVVPHWEEIEDNPAYRVLGDSVEPWGSPAKVVQGPILIASADGGTITLADCVFYACTGGARTANFGAANIVPWTANGKNTPLPGVTMQAPLSYLEDYPFVLFDYAPSETIFSRLSGSHAAAGSFLTLFSEQPGGFTMLNIVEDLQWMAVRPESLTIGTTDTGWPGTARPAIAVVDTGGGPFFLSDPDGHIWFKTWRDTVVCPSWAGTSQNCNCIGDEITVGLTDGTTSFAYTIDQNRLPFFARGLTGVMCENNAFMMGQYGLNTGGLSALFVDILVDYVGNRVGFRHK